MDEGKLKELQAIACAPIPISNSHGHLRTPTIERMMEGSDCRVNWSPLKTVCPPAFYFHLQGQTHVHMGI